MTGLLAACDDPDLLNVDLWPAQRDMLAAIERHRETVLCLGRRSGKSLMSAVVAVHNCTLRPDLGRLVRPGETRYALVVATNLAQARLVVAAARSIVERSPLLSGLLDRASEDELTFTLPDGSRTALRAIPCTARGARGYPVSCLVFDEHGHHVSDDTFGNQTAAQVYGALLPSVAQFGEMARVVVASTPLGSTGNFAKLFNRASGDPAAAVFHLPTSAVNPTIDVEFLEAERARDEWLFRREFLAEFIEAGTPFLDLAGVQLGRLAQPSEGREWTLGLDPATSARGDGFGVAVVGRSTSTAGQLVVGHIESFRPSGDVVADLARVSVVSKMFGCSRGATDQWSAEALIALLRREGVSVAKRTMTPQSKSAVFSELKARIDLGELVLPDDPRLLGELRRVQLTERAGAAAVSIPRVGGSHGDAAQALALAVFELSGQAQSVTTVDWASAWFGAPSRGPRPALAEQLGLKGRRYEDEPQPGEGRPGIRDWRYRS
jgi:phage terminase large subunit-like protein